MVVLETIVRLELLVISKGKKKKKFMWYLRFFFFFDQRYLGLLVWYLLGLYIYIYIKFRVFFFFEESFELICNGPN